MKWAGYVACMREKNDVYSALVGKTETVLGGGFFPWGGGKAAVVVDLTTSLRLSAEVKPYLHSP
jgi:hypothetical protein